MASVIFTDSGFWSKLDPADQPYATTFPTILDAVEHMAGSEVAGRPAGVSCVPVVPDEPGGFASIAACARTSLKMVNSGKRNCKFPTGLVTTCRQRPSVPSSRCR